MDIIFGDSYARKDENVGVTADFMYRMYGMPRAHGCAGAAIAPDIMYIKEAANSAAAFNVIHFLRAA